MASRSFFKGAAQKIPLNPFKTNHDALKLYTGLMTVSTVQRSVRFSMILSMGLYAIGASSIVSVETLVV